LGSAEFIMMIDRPQGTPWILRLLSCIRFDEVLVLQGAPLLGAIFSIGHLDSAKLLALTLLVVGNCLLVAHVFLLNDWAGIEHDLRDPSRAARVFLNRGIGRGEIGALLLTMLVLSLVLLSRLNATTLMIGLAIAIASVLYSAPGLHMKGVPFFSSVLHLVSGMLHFLLGYSVFHSLDAQGLVIGAFFATVFSAGHLTQEVRDFEADLRNGIQTNAVRFGKTRTFITGFALFTFADALLIVLAASGAMPCSLIVVAMLYPLHFYWSLRAMREGLSFESVRTLQVRYRLLYAGIGALMVVSTLGSYPEAHLLRFT
jgi:4-hydroxybenzoate polyprenyltransferase